MQRRSFLALATISVASASTLASCSASNSSDDSSSYSIGITQIVTHTSLDAAREGFKAALEAAGLSVTYDEQNAQGDQATATSIATKFASADLDLVLAIATPAAQAVAQAVTTIPVLFTAVTDPEAAELVATAEVPGANITGTTDMNPVAEQIGLIKKFSPEATSVGIIYSSGEVNSEVQVELAKTAAAAEGLTVKEATITNSSEVQQAAATLTDVSAIYVPTDNNVVSALPSVLQVGEDNQIPVIVGEADSVRNGGLATYGIDYTKLGEQTGQMAVRILVDGDDPATMPVETQAEYSLVINSAAAGLMGVAIPDDLQADAEIVG